MVKLYQRILEKMKKSNSKKEYEAEFIEFVAFLCKKDFDYLDVLYFFFNEYQKNAPAQKGNTGEIERIYKQCKSYSKVAKDLGLSYNTVRSKLEECDKKNQLFEELKIDDRYIAYIKHSLDNTQEGLTINKVVYESLIKSREKQEALEGETAADDEYTDFDWNDVIVSVDTLFESDCANEDIDFGNL